MFLPEDEVQRRLSTEENLLNRISRSEISSLPPDQVVPPSLPLDIAELISGISEQPKEVEGPRKKGPIDFETADERKAQKALERMLNPDSYAGRGTKDLSRDTQAAIGVTAGILGTTKAARLGDVSIQGAHSYERGFTTPNDVGKKAPKEELREKIIAGHGIIVDKTFNRLMFTLGLLDDAKLREVKRATDLSVIAKNLSGIVSHATQATQDKGLEINDNNVHFHIMRPEQAVEAEYPVIEISSQREEEAYVEKTRDQ